MATLTVQQAVELAGQFHAAGRGADAEAIYRKVLAQDPRQAGALHGLGILAYESGDAVGAAKWIGQAVALKPTDASYQSNYGSVLLAAGRNDESIAALRKAVTLKPDWADGHYNLANALKQAGQTPAAIDEYRLSVSLDPANFEAFGNLGAALLGSDRADEAVVVYRQAVNLRPQAPDAHHNLGLALQKTKAFVEAIAAFRKAIELRPEYAEAHNGLGVALESNDQTDEAIAAFYQALALRPDYPEALNGLGVTHQFKKQFHESIEYFRRAIALQPVFPEALCSLGAVLLNVNQPDEAFECLKQALVQRPGFAEAQANLGSALVERGELAPAIVLFRSAVAKLPEDGEIHWSLGNALLLAGEHRQGWAEYEWRRAHRSFEGKQIDQALADWRGEELHGRHILLHAEQGYGDAIQFVRYAPMVNQRGGRVLLGCPQEMFDLMSTVPGVERVITRYEEAPRTLDLHCSLMSLPNAFGTSIDTIPANVPYFFPDQPRIEFWRNRMGGDTRLKVGIVWQGRTAHANDINRSINLRRFAPLAAVEGVSFYSLQKWKPPPAENQLLPEMSLIDWTDEMPNFIDTAAFISNLDLVIAVDTAVCHLTGALGKRVWVMVPFSPDFRWMLNRDDSPWYPTMRLFRQPRRLAWDEPIQVVAGELRKLVTERGSA